ncbi:hypothetical protein GCWU000342_02152 [Shuttleworthella satelles DSM 14600]|uniref:Uncharacterized protein n=1 Tax=Shuttleworthella satelles DSM 14600 TaxID=626523 RepID=C4GDH8_9FIRM|nr:hypothetical protein GCWU000342_02152 [Shuttleworthia satelles DSM 14600]
MNMNISHCSTSRSLRLHRLSRAHLPAPPSRFKNALGRTAIMFQGRA